MGDEAVIEDTTTTITTISMVTKETTETTTSHHHKTTTVAILMETITSKLKRHHLNKTTGDILLSMATLHSNHPTTSVSNKLVMAVNHKVDSVVSFNKYSIICRSAHN